MANRRSSAEYQQSGLSHSAEPVTLSQLQHTETQEEEFQCQQWEPTHTGAVSCLDHLDQSVTPDTEATFISNEVQALLSDRSSEVKGV